MRKKRIAIDMDNTIFRWHEELNRTMLRLDPSAPVLKECTKYDVLIGAGGSQELVDAAMSDSGFYARLLPFDGAIDAIHRLEDAGHELYLLSTPDPRNPTCASDKLASADHWLGAGWADRTVLTRDKTLCRADYLIDDKDVIHGAMTPEWTQIMYTQGWNKHVEARHRTDTWSEVLQTINTLSQRN